MPHSLRVLVQEAVSLLSEIISRGLRRIEFAGSCPVLFLGEYSPHVFSIVKQTSEVCESEFANVLAFGALLLGDKKCNL